MLADLLPELQSDFSFYATDGIIIAATTVLGLVLLGRTHRSGNWSWAVDSHLTCRPIKDLIKQDLFHICQNRPWPCWSTVSEWWMTRNQIWVCWAMRRRTRWSRYQFNKVTWHGLAKPFYNIIPTNTISNTLRCHTRSWCMDPTSKDQNQKFKLWCCSLRGNQTCTTFIETSILTLSLSPLWKTLLLTI